MSEIEDEFICDYCEREVSEDEIGDCAPDEEGYCILCGHQIEGRTNG